MDKIHSIGTGRNTKKGANKMFLKWFFPRVPNRTHFTKGEPKVTWEASQFLYYIWRKISHGKQYGHRDVMIHIGEGQYIFIRNEIEEFLMNRGYDINYFNGVCGKIEIIISW